MARLASNAGRPQGAEAALYSPRRAALVTSTAAQASPVRPNQGSRAAGFAGGDQGGSAQQRVASALDALELAGSAPPVQVRASTAKNKYACFCTLKGLAFSSGERSHHPQGAQMERPPILASDRETASQLRARVKALTNARRREVRIVDRAPPVLGRQGSKSLTRSFTVAPQEQERAAAAGRPRVSVRNWNIKDDEAAAGGAPGGVSAPQTRTVAAG